MSIKEKIKKEQKKRKVKGICGTLLFHAVLFFLLSLPFMSLSYEDPPPERGIPVKFEKGDSNEGEESAEAEGKDETEGKEENVDETEGKLEDEEKEVENEEKEIENEEKEIENEEKKVENEEKKVENEEQQYYEKKENGNNADKDIDGHDYEDEEKGGGKEKDGGKGKGDGKDKGEKKRECFSKLSAQGKGLGKVTIEVEVGEDGKVIDIDKETFKSTLEKGNNNLTSNDEQKRKLFEAIKKNCFCEKWHKSTKESWQWDFTATDPEKEDPEKK